MTYCGINVELRPGRAVELHQRDYASILLPLNREELLKDKKLRTNAEKTKTACRKFIGGLLWLLRTRYDLSFLASFVSSLMIQAAIDPVVMDKMIAASVKACKLDTTMTEGLFFILSKMHLVGGPNTLN